MPQPPLSVPCPICNGKGKTRTIKVYDHACSLCDGTGQTDPATAAYLGDPIGNGLWAKGNKLVKPLQEAQP